MDPLVPQAPFTTHSLALAVTKLSTAVSHLETDLSGLATKSEVTKLAEKIEEYSDWSRWAVRTALAVFATPLLLGVLVGAIWFVNR